MSNNHTCIYQESKDEFPMTKLSYIVVDLPFPMEIKEINSSGGDKHIFFYLVDPLSDVMK